MTESKKKEANEKQEKKVWKVFLPQLVSSLGQSTTEAQHPRLLPTPLISRSS